MSFERLLPAADDLFYRRGDPNDLRLGELVLRAPADYARAAVALVGCPQDEGVTRNRGRPGARRAPAEIRRALYRYPVGEAHRELRLVDLGDVPIQPTLEETHDILGETVTVLLRDGKKVVVLGGGNDISYPDCRALAGQAERVLVFNLDRHLDVRADAVRNSGTPYRQLLEEGLIRPERFHEVGTNTFANSETYLKYVEGKGAHVHLLGAVRERGVGATLRAVLAGSDADAIFFGFDLDVVRAMEAPGVSDPGPMGLSAREVCEAADVAAGDPRTRIVEITEVNPDHDVNGITCQLAANIIFRALAAPGS